MKPQNPFVFTDVMYPFSGLDAYSPTTMVQKGSSPSLLNVECNQGVAERRQGLLKFGLDAGTVGDALEGTVLGLIEFVLADGTKHDVCVTTKYQYLYVSATDSWTNISKISGTPVAWTGDESNELDWCIARDTNGLWLIITNGKDPPQRWDGSNQFQDLDVDTSTIIACKSVAMFCGSLFLFNVTLSGPTNYPQDVAWSAPGDFTKWDFLTDGSGTQTIANAVGSGKKLLPLGEYLYAYSEQSITQITYTGSTYGYSFVTVVRNISIPSQRAIVNLGTYHVFYGEDNFYMFDGTSMLRPIGTEIYKDFVSQVDRSCFYKAFGLLDVDRKRAYFVLPFVTGHAVYTLNFETHALYNVIQSANWTKSEFTDHPTCFGFFSVFGGTTWTQLLTTPWSTLLTTRWSEMLPTSTAYKLVVGGDAEVLRKDSSVSTDDSTSFTAYLDTIDFTIPQAYETLNGRWIEAELELAGSNVTVEYSSDRGQSYLGATDFVLTTDWTRHKFYFDVVSDTLRLKLSSTTGTFSVRWIRVWVRPAGAD